MTQSAGRKPSALGSRLLAIGLVVCCCPLSAADFLLRGDIAAGYLSNSSLYGSSYDDMLAGSCYTLSAGPVWSLGKTLDLSLSGLYSGAGLASRTRTASVDMHGVMGKVGLNPSKTLSPVGIRFGIGYGYVRDIVSGTASSSFLASAGIGVPIRLSDRWRLNLGAEVSGGGSRGISAEFSLGPDFQFPRAKPHPVPRERGPTAPPKVGPVAMKPRPAFPPKLEARVAFEETGRRNQALDADEQFYIVVTVANKGKGKAEGVRVRAEAISSMAGVSVGKDVVIPEISPGGTAQAKVSLAAAEDVPDQEIRFRVSTIEPVFGADALPNVITITSRAIAPPDLVAYDNSISDDMTESEWTQGNGNGELELNEQVEVTTIVQNKGIGTAYDVSITVRPTDPNVLYQSPNPVLSLGDIPAGEWRKLQYPIFVNARFKADTAKLILDIAEQRSRFSRKDTVCIPLNVEMSKLAEVVVQPRARPGIGPASQPPSLTDSLLIGIPKGRQDPDAFAVVIGAANYRHVTKVEYAAKDAEAMRRYLIAALGYLDGNIITLPDPTSGDLNRVFGTAGRPEGQLYNLVSAKPGRCDVFVYYVGHGAPSLREKKGYLVPIDASPDYIEQNGFPLDLLYSNLSKVPAKNLTVVLDACFSGETPDASGGVGSLVQHASPVPVASVSEEVPANSLVMAAAKSNQLACWYPDKHHSLFTYFLLKGLKGEADLDKDRAIEVRELDEYVRQNVSPIARRLYNRDQTPEFRGAAGTELLRIE